MGASVRPSDPVADYLAEKQKAEGATGHSDPVADYLAAKQASAPKASTPEGPGVLSRAAGMVGHAVMHPIDTIESAVSAPIKSAFTATVAPGVGEARPDARLSKGGNSSGRAIDTSPYDAEHGGVTTKERTAAGIQSVVNAAAPSIAGALPKALALPAVGAASGAAYSRDDPLAGALAGGFLAPAVGAAVKGTVGATKLAKTVSRVRSAEPLGENVARQTGASEIVDRANYGQAEAEGRDNPTSSVLRDALDHDRVKPYVELFRASDAGKGASDATVAREALKLMSRDQRNLEQKMEIKGEYDAAADLKARDLRNARRMLKEAVATPGEATLPALETAQTPAPALRDAINDFHTVKGVAAKRTQGTVEQQSARRALERHDAENVASPSLRGAPEPRTVETPPVMPSLPDAISEHARMMRNRQAFNTGADQTRRILNNVAIPAKKLDTQGGPAFLEQIRQMDPEEAAHATTGTLGRTNDLTKYHAPDHHTTAFGAVAGAARPILKINSMRRYIDALDQQSGHAKPPALDLDLIMRNMGLVNAGVADSTKR